jgi:hypothetical protein
VVKVRAGPPWASRHHCLAASTRRCPMSCPALVLNAASLLAAPAGRVDSPGRGVPASSS